MLDILLPTEKSVRLLRGYIDNWQLRFSLAGESTDYTHNLQAKYHNNIQKLCEAADFGVPMMLCVDPATGWGINQDVSGYEAKNNHKVVGRLVLQPRIGSNQRSRLCERSGWNTCPGLQSTWC